MVCLWSRVADPWQPLAYVKIHVFFSELSALALLALVACFYTNKSLKTADKTAWFWKRFEIHLLGLLWWTVVLQDEVMNLAEKVCGRVLKCVIQKTELPGDEAVRVLLDFDTWQCSPAIAGLLFRWRFAHVGCTCEVWRIGSNAEWVRSQRCMSACVHLSANSI